MVTASEISIAIAAIGVASAAVFAMIQLRNLVKARRMDLIMRLYMAWGEESMKAAFARFLAAKTDDYDEFVKKHGSYGSPDRDQIWTDLDRICWFLNGVCFLVYRKLADARDVDDLIGHGIPKIWERARPLVEGLRKELNSPQSYRWLERMYNEKMQGDRA
jgi:hypothetical protein